MELEAKIEAVLFYKAAPMKKQAICKLFAVATEELEAALQKLQTALTKRGVRLFISDEEVSLATAPEVDELIESLRKDELKRDIGKAGAETLAIVLYRGPISRTDIDRIRGVNSAYILRNLLTRGLIERDQSARSTIFKPTTELLRNLGISDRTELNDFSTVMNALDTYEADQAEQLT